MRNKIAALAAVLMVSAAGGAVGAQQAATVTGGIYTEAQAARGHDQYTTNCAPCHGATLSGSGEAPALVGGEFLSDWIGLTVGDLFDRIRTSMPQDAPGKLSRDQYAAILSYVLKQNGYPAGAKDLD